MVEIEVGKWNSRLFRFFVDIIFVDNMNCLSTFFVEFVDWCDVVTGIGFECKLFISIKNQRSEIASG